MPPGGVVSNYAPDNLGSIAALYDILHSLVSGLTGCLSGFIPPQGVQIIIKVGLGIINKFFGSEALKGCMGNPPGGSGPGLVGF